MSFNSFGLVSFDHNQQKWATYKSRLTQWFLANDIDAEEGLSQVKRRAYLLSALADDTYQLVSDLALPKNVQEVPYKEIVQILDEHFTPKHVGFGERHKFYAATQLPTETPSQWGARLRGLTASCKFTNVEETLRDRFMMGMLAGPEKERLYVQDVSGLTFAKAVEMAEDLKSARAAASAASTSSSDPLYKIDKEKKNKKDGNKEKCSVCGYTNHTTTECRFANYTCKKCNKKGHLRRMCRTVKSVKLDEVSESDGDDGECFNIRSTKGEPLVESVRVNGVNLPFEVDSGSAVTVIPNKIFAIHFAKVSLSDTRTKLVSYTGELIDCMGCVNMEVEWRGVVHELRMFVVRQGGPPLLGRDFIAKFNLQLSPVHNNSVVCSDIEALKLRFADVFSNKLGMFKKYKVKLTLKPGSEPIYVRARPMAFALRDKVEKELNRLVKLGIIRPVSYSAYASPVVPVLKRNGSLRLCVDYSVTLNKQLVVDKYPLPTIKELFSRLHGGQQFSKLDLSMAYNQFVLEEESQMYTCINTHRGLFAYNRLAFGLSSAPAIFQRAMEGLLGGIDGVLCLLDDVCITGRDRAEHLARLHEVLRRLQDAGLVLQQEKCEYFKDEINYLGYVISRDGLKKSPEKIKAITEAPVPANVTQLQSFLGLINYYRCFVPRASTILSPLYELLKKGVKWRWSDVENDTFNNIKKMLTSDQVLAHYNANAKIILTVDASPYGLGAILSQIDSDNCERPVAFASRTLNSAEKRYSQIQKEATAIIFGVRRFHQYLYGRSTPFVLRTDHKPLLSIFGHNKGVPEVSANRLQRYALFLSSYNYVIEYVKSKDNSADYLSRVCIPPTLEGDDRAAGADEAREEADFCDRAAYVRFVVRGNSPVTLHELRDATSKDPTLREVIKFVLKGWPRNTQNEELKPYFQCKLQLSYEGGCLMRGHKVVIPELLRGRVLKELHSSHLGIVKTKAEARSRLWFPGIDQAIEGIVGDCEVCNTVRASPPRAPPSPWPQPPHAFYRVHLDFLGPIHGRMYLVIVDAFSKWVEAYEMSSCNSSAVIEKMYEFMSRFGVPNTLVTDNGTAFCSQEFDSFCNLNGVRHLTSPAYHPASNGQAEIYVKVVKRGIKTSILSSSNVKDSKLNLLKYLFDYRNSVHSSTNTSPAQLVFGRKLRSRLDLMTPVVASPSSTAPMSQEIDSEQCLPNKSGSKRSDLHIGQYVLYKKFSEKDRYRWCKGIIVKILGRMLFFVRDLETSDILKKHKNQILLYKGNIHGKQPPWGVKDLPTSRVTDQADSVQLPERERNNDMDDIMCTAPDDMYTSSAANTAEEGNDDDGSSAGRHDTATCSRGDHGTTSCPEEAAAVEDQPVRQTRNRPRVDYKKYF